MNKFNLKMILVSAISLGVLSLGTTSVAHADSNGISHYTRYDMEQMLAHKNEARYQMPKFNGAKVKNLTQAKDTFDGTQFKNQQLDVWDSWVVKDSTGNPANIHGYHVVFALVGNSNKSIQNYLAGKIGVFYQKVGASNKGLKSWKYAGPLFDDKTEGGNTDNDVFNHETGEWSGSAMLQSDGNIRLMYTSFSGSKDYGGYGDNRQTLSTAQVTLDKTKHGLAVNHNKATDHKDIFAGDGKYYETVQESTDKTGFSHDDHTLRDPQIFEANGHKYLLFEGNTSKDDGASGVNSLNNNQYYGGNAGFKTAQRQLFDKDPQLKTYGGSTEGLRESAQDDNGCLGLLELNNDYTVKKVLPPLVTFNLVDDETERPSIVHYNNRWYIFTAMHGWHMASTNAGTNDSFMLGFSSKNLLGGYKPLNKFGLVAYSKQNIKSRTYTYSYAMNQAKKNPFLLTSYMNQLGNISTGYATFAPTVQVNIKGQFTKINPQPLQQGQIVK